MRNFTKMLLCGVFMALFMVLFFVGPTVKRTEPVVQDITLFMGVILLFCWVTFEIAKKYSHWMTGYGEHTTLEQVHPVSTCELPDPVKPEKVWKFGLYPRGGVTKLGMGGGGSSGYTVARSDLIQRARGDLANVAIWGIPKIFKMDALPNSKYLDLRDLPMEIYSMIINHSAFNPKHSCVYVYMDPLEVDPRTQAKALEQMNYQALWFEVNEVNKHLLEVNNTLLASNSKYASANEKNARAYASEQPNTTPRQKRRDDDDNEQR